MKKILSAMLGLALSLAWSGASARVADRRAVEQSEPVPAKMIQSAEAKKSLRRAKPRVTGDFKRPVRRAVARKAPSANPTICASIFAYAPDDNAGIYTMTPSDYGFTPVKADDNLNSANGGAFANGVFYNITESGRGNSWRANDWSRISGPAETDIECRAMAADPSTGTIYAIEESANGFDFITINPSDFSRASTICTYGEAFELVCLFFDLKGNMYGITSGSFLYQINKTTGATSVVGKTGIQCYWGAGAVVDPESGVCFVAGDDLPSALYELDLETAVSSLIYEFEEDEEINCIFIMPKSANLQVPEAAESLTASFPEGNLAGTVSWTAPANTADGSAGSGDLSYSLKCNNVEIASGAAEWGATQSISHTVDKAGSYAFSVTFSTEQGESAPVSSTLWIGHDTPLAVTDAKATRSGSENTISWKASAGGSHGGYVNLAEVTYKVTRRPDGEVIAASTAETSVVDQLADGNSPILYSYDITPLYQGREAQTASTGQVMVGAVYYNPFDTREQFNEWKSTTLQSNPMYDIPVWEYDSSQKAAGVGYCEVVAVAAWLTSPALTLESGKAYKLSFETWCSNSSYDEQLSVYISSSNNPATMLSQTPVIEKMIVNNGSSNKKTTEVVFTPEESGTYYIAFNGCSQPDLGTLYLDNVLFYSVPILPVPEAPTISCSVFGGSMLMVTATAPSKDVEGNDLTALTRLIVKRDDTVIYTKDEPEVGETYNFFDFLPGDGRFVYSAVAYSEAGASAAGTTVVSTIEAGAPRSATNLQTVEDGNSGTITLSWKAPETDVNNIPIEDGSLTFDVYAEGESEPLFTDLTETSKTWQAVEPGKQEFLSFYVIAKNEAGSGARSDASMPLAVGTPYSVPFAESFAGMEFSNLWSFYNSDDYSEARWLLVAASETPKADPVDGDGGMLAFTGEFLEETAWATSGKIDLTGSRDPKLTFYYFAQNKKEGKDQLDVYVSDGSGYKRLDSFTMRDLELDGWQKREIDLSAYTDKTISLRFVGVSFRTENFMLIDKIEISSAKDDLAVTMLGVPGSVVLGKSFNVQTVISNNSSKPAGSYSVVLYRNGAKAEVESGSSLAAGQQAAYI
ncbi:MAG: choice-of-anchor J domain-containing protein, partial [Muribaculaceae bacterium]|nr:choice-of-anchor J domain-containing protein [Muribaculaceae bacterium]